MSLRHTTARTILLVTMCAVLLTGTGCADHDSTGTQPSSNTVTSSVAHVQPGVVVTSPAVKPPAELPAPLRNVDRSSPDAVAAAAATVWYSWDTPTDSGTYDAQLRAVPLLDPAVATDLIAHPPISGPGADWLGLVAAGAHATVTTHPAQERGAPADTGDKAYRLLTVTQTFDGHPAPAARHLVVGVVLRREFDGWRVLTIEAR